MSLQEAKAEMDERKTKLHVISLPYSYFHTASNGKHLEGFMVTPTSWFVIVT